MKSFKAEESSSSCTTCLSKITCLLILKFPFSHHFVHLPIHSSSFSTRYYKKFRRVTGIEITVGCMSLKSSLFVSIEYFMLSRQGSNGKDNSYRLNECWLCSIRIHLLLICEYFYTFRHFGTLYRVSIAKLA